MDPKEFEKQYMCRLNARQKEAVFAVDGPVLLLGKGSSFARSTVSPNLSLTTLAAATQAARPLIW